MSKTLNGRLLPGILIGILTAGAALLVCTYGAAFRWAANAGVILGLDLVPSGFRSPAPAWPFTLATGVLVAAAVLLLMRLQSEPLRTGALVSSAVVALVGLLAALGTAYFVDDPVQDQSAWQRFSTFLSQSEAIVVFTAITVLVAMAAMSRSDPESDDDGTVSEELVSRSGTV